MMFFQNLVGKVKPMIIIFMALILVDVEGISTLNQRASDILIATITWNTGASVHAVNDKSVYQTIKSTKPIELELADGSTERAEVKESVFVKVQNTLL